MCFDSCPPPSPFLEKLIHSCLILAGGEVVGIQGPTADGALEADTVVGPALTGHDLLRLKNPPLAGGAGIPLPGSSFDCGCVHHGLWTLYLISHKNNIQAI